MDNPNFQILENSKPQPQRGGKRMINKMMYIEYKVPFKWFGLANRTTGNKYSKQNGGLRL